MTPDKTRYAVEVMQEFLRGRKIKCRGLGSSGLWFRTDNPNWDWYHYEYCVEREPLRFWMNVYSCGPILGSIHESEQEAREEARKDASRVAVPIVEELEIAKGGD